MTRAEMQKAMEPIAEKLDANMTQFMGAFETILNSLSAISDTLSNVDVEDAVVAVERMATSAEERDAARMKLLNEKLSNGGSSEAISTLAAGLQHVMEGVDALKEAIKQPRYVVGEMPKGNGGAPMCTACRHLKVDRCMRPDVLTGVPVDAYVSGERTNGVWYKTCGRRARYFEPIG